MPVQLPELVLGEEKSLKKKNAFLVLEEKFGKKNDKLVRRKVDVTRATGMSLK